MSRNPRYSIGPTYRGVGGTTVRAAASQATPRGSGGLPVGLSQTPSRDGEGGPRGDHLSVAAPSLIPVGPFRSPSSAWESPSTSPVSPERPRSPFGYAPSSPVYESSPEYHPRSPVYVPSPSYHPRSPEYVPSPGYEPRSPIYESPPARRPRSPVYLPSEGYRPQSPVYIASTQHAPLSPVYAQPERRRPRSPAHEPSRGREPVPPLYVSPSLVLRGRVPTGRVVSGISPPSPIGKRRRLEPTNLTPTTFGEEALRGLGSYGGAKREAQGWWRHGEETESEEEDEGSLAPVRGEGVTTTHGHPYPLPAEACEGRASIRSQHERAEAGSPTRGTGARRYAGRSPETSRGDLGRYELNFGPGGGWWESVPSPSPEYEPTSPAGQARWSPNGGRPLFAAAGGVEREERQRKRGPDGRTSPETF